ncbi:MAG: alpha-hydroxy acid oxidase [Sneathiellaceae bacterium]
MASLAAISNVQDLRSAARRRLPRAVFDFIDGAAGDEWTARRNVAAFGDWGFLPRVGRDVSRTDLATTLLGRPAAMPLALAPIGFAGIAWPQGEILAARSAARAGLPFCLSTNSVAGLEDVARAAPDATLWFQLYFLKDRDWMRGLVRRARDAGYAALCLTLDLPVAGRRERDLRNGFTVPVRPTLANAADLALHLPWLLRSLRHPVGFGNFRGNPHAAGFASIARHVASLFDATAGWQDVEDIRALWDGPLVLKGILHPDDAERAVALGADAISVSNHGGRQLDGVPAALDALGEIAGRVGGRTELLLDGGVRRGTDVLKARALGATAVLLGRAYVWGLAAAGEAGVDKVAALFRDEMETALMLLGETAVGELGPDHVMPLRRAA